MALKLPSLGQVQLGSLLAVHHPQPPGGQQEGPQDPAPQIVPRQLHQDLGRVSVYLAKSRDCVLEEQGLCQSPDSRA